MIIVFRIKNFLYNLRKNFNKKVLLKIKKSRTVRKDITTQLRNLGYKKIRFLSLPTWKVYNENDIRITFLARYNGKKYTIKITKGYGYKLKNSLLFQKTFNDIFDFIPKGFEIELNGYVGVATEYIPSFPLDYIKYTFKKLGVDHYLKQFNYILDEFNNYKLVHCDLNSVNFLVSKKENKLYVIDFDTVYCEKYGLKCETNMPDTIRRREKYRTIYDDAYSIVRVLNNLGITDSIYSENEEFRALKGKIDRNTFIIYHKNF